MAKLKAPKGVSSFSHGGKLYEVKRGAIDLPEEAIEVAMSHGFTVGASKDEPEEVEQAPAEEPVQE